MIKIIGNTETSNTKIISKINNTKIDFFYIKNKDNFRDRILEEINKDDEILDIGKGMRDKYKNINCKKKEILNKDTSDDADIIFDLCQDLDNTLMNKYDKIICLAILEHVYNPFLAVNNLKLMLRENGLIFGYVPYLYFYHAPKDLKFQDFFRFSKDALAYLFKDFSEVTLFPVRGRVSAPLNLLFAGIWKKYIEKTSLNILLDKFASNEQNLKQCSGFNFIVRK